IALHQFFATNSSIDKEALEKLRIPAMADQTLAMVFHRLEMVSWLGDTSHNADLFDCAAAPQSDLEGTVARMVLAANLLDGKDGDDKPVVPQIRKLLMSRLNVNSETPRAKYYGSESKFLEFKTSLVFPATGRGEQMKTDPVAQQNHILSRIAGMLNADGGRLYIGVNDQGYEVGMHDDFEYYRRQNVFDGKASHRIGNIADLCKFLELLINNRFEKKAARRITVSADSEAAKGVVEITIEESLEPVFLDGRLYVRQSGEVTQEYHGAEIMEFENERRHLRDEREQLRLLNASRLSFSADDEQPGALQHHSGQPEKAASPAPGAADPQPKSMPETAPGTERTDSIATSKWRPNVLHDYEPDYRQTNGYIYFKGNTISYSGIDTYFDTDPACRLALAVPHDMSHDGYLLLGFDGLLPVET
ncbi:MAG: ATP-binding protein, partial [Muribaculaceae bacterium]|nr:ATP-binding protein [Muribaculaceae bacterium]